MSNKSLTVEVLPPAMKVPSIAPKLKNGADSTAAKNLLKMYSDAQNGMRRIIALGLAAWEIKMVQLKHNEFGPWLAIHAPGLCRADSKTGKPKASTALNNFMELTQGVLENVGFPSLEKYFETVAKFPHAGICSGGGLLLLPDKKIPVEAKPLREKIFALVDGKTQRQLFLEFKQADEDTGKPKIGRRMGEGGATKQQRANAAELEAQERITEKLLKAEEIAGWLMEMADDKGLGEIAGTAELAALDKAMETARGYIKHGGGK